MLDLPTSIKIVNDICNALLSISNGKRVKVCSELIFLDQNNTSVLLDLEVPGMSTVDDQMENLGKLLTEVFRAAYCIGGEDVNQYLQLGDAFTDPDPLKHPSIEDIRTVLSGTKVAG